MTGKAVLSNRIYLTKTEELFNKLREELTYIIPSPRPGGKPETVCDIIFASRSVLSIPIGRIDLIPSDYEIVDKRVTEWTDLPEPLTTLREDQIEIYDAVEDNCLINAKPGWGKTFVALNIAYKLAQKTLIVVHNTALRDQWVDETKKVFGFEPGIVGSGTQATHTDIVISNTQTLNKYVQKYNKMFGTIICDEAHRVPSTLFKNIIDTSYARYKIGLSATLKRRDNKHVFIPDYFSTNRLIPSVDTAMTPIIKIIHTNISLSESKIGKSGYKRMMWQDLITLLSQNPQYIELLHDITKIKTEVENHKVLLVADRIELLEKLGAMLPSSVVVTGDTRGQPRDYRAKIHASFYEDNPPYNTLIGTTSIYKEGISVNPLSCLILGTQISSEPLLEQIVGRVTRPYPGKKQPEIIDIALKSKHSQRQLSNRINYYVSKGYKIEEIYLD